MTSFVSNFRRAPQRGRQGAPGVQGSPQRGIQGFTGVTAEAFRGVQGPDGIDLVGLTGRQGDAGIDLPGLTGRQGQTGKDLPGFRGLQGQAGEDLPGFRGRQGLTGQDLPGFRGQQGTAGMDLPGFRGQQGEAGVDLPGVRGPQGEQGEDLPGFRGQQGRDGVDLPGFRGRQGQDGSDLPGFEGSQGRAGVDTQGFRGSQGDMGSQGTTPTAVAGAGAYVDSVTLAPQQIVSAPGYVLVGSLAAGAQYTTVAQAIAAFSSPYTAVRRNQNIVVLSDTVETSPLPLSGSNGGNWFVRLNSATTWSFANGITLSDGALGGGQSFDIVGSDSTSVLVVDPGAAGQWANLGGAGSQLTLRCLSVNNVTVGQPNAWLVDGNANAGISVIVRSCALSVAGAVHGFRALGSGSIVSDISFGGITPALPVVARLIEAQVQPMTLRNIWITDTTTLDPTLPLINAPTSRVVLDGLTSDGSATPWSCLLEMSQVIRVVDPLLSLTVHSIVNLASDREAQINVTQCWLSELTLDNVGDTVGTEVNYTPFAHVHQVHLTGNLVLRRGNPLPANLTNVSWRQINVTDCELADVTASFDAVDPIIVSKAYVFGTALQNWRNPAVAPTLSVTDQLAFVGNAWVNVSSPLTESIQEFAATGASANVLMFGNQFTDVHVSCLANNVRQFTFSGNVISTSVDWSGTTYALNVGATSPSVTGRLVHGNAVYVNGTLAGSPTVNAFVRMTGDSTIMTTDNFIHAPSDPTVFVIESLQLDNVTSARVMGNQCNGRIGLIGTLISGTVVTDNVADALSVSATNLSRTIVNDNHFATIVPPAMSIGGTSHDGLIVSANQAQDLSVTAQLASTVIVNNDLVGTMTFSGAVADSQISGNSALSLSLSDGITNSVVCNNLFTQATTGGMIIVGATGTTINSNGASDLFLTDPIANTIKGNRLSLDATSIVFNPLGTSGWNNAIVGNACGSSSGSPGTIDLSNFANAANRDNTVVANVLYGGTVTGTTVNDQVGFNF